jgi:phytoene synthase
MQPIESHSQSSAYCAEMVRAHDRDLYALALFTPEPARANLLILYALATELAHIPRMVSEEMIGHIRYAWWRETLEGLYAGTPRPGHPILEALAPLLPILPQENLMALVEAYATPYPEPPQGEAAALVPLSWALIAATAPRAVTPWQKAHRIIARHHEKHGRKRASWLMLKLLIAGYI